MGHLVSGSALYSFAVVCYCVRKASCFGNQSYLDRETDVEVLTWNVPLLLAMLQHPTFLSDANGTLRICISLCISNLQFARPHQGL